jgi:hypothetical protein
MRELCGRFEIRWGELILAGVVLAGLAGPATAQGGGLVAAYGFDEGSGSTVGDVSGQGNHGSISGATWTTSGRYGPALVFDGTNDVVVVADSTSLDLTNGMTLSAWVYPTSSLSGWKAILQKETDAWFLNANTGGDRAGTGGTLNGVCCTVLQGPSALAVNRWTHVAATYDGTTLRLYLDATQVASQARSGNLQVNAAPLRIGGNTYGSEFFPGRIDEVRIYNRALSAAEIQADMNAPIGSAPPSPSPSPDPGLTLRWQQPADSAPVDEFRIYKGPAVDQGTRIYTGMPAPDAQGIHSADVQIAEIAEGIPVYVWVTAANSAGESAPSNANLYAAGCDAGADADCDGVPDVPNASPCATGQTVGCDDNCPYWENPGQEDRGGVGRTSLPDGIGDVCQCGDVDGDGRIGLMDSVIIQRALFNRATMSKPELCDVDGSATCTLADAAIVLQSLSVPPSATIRQECDPALMP